jgi:phenylacetate-CoA ligase
MDLNKIYSKLPIGLQNYLISIYGLYWKKRRFSGIYQQELIGAKKREEFSTTEWKSFAEQALQHILSNAINYVPYYTTSLDQDGFTSERLKNFSINDLKGLPFLSKENLRKYGTSSLVSKKLEKNGQFYPSSGSTGTPTRILFSHAMHQRWSAIFEARIRNWAGVDRHTPRGMIGGRRVVPEGSSKGPFYRYNSFEKQTYFSAYHISADTCENYLKGMLDNKVEYMTGYAFSNYSLAKFFKKNKIKPPKMKAVITSSEKLTKEMRETLEEVYQCKAYDSYSGLEACGLISECEEGSLHISPDVGILEIINDNGEYAKPGESGELVCTGLLNYDQPLIRYKIGDRVRLAINQNCKCGRQMPIVDEILGRNEDVVKGTDGREMVRFHGIFVDLPNLMEGQIIQQDISHIIVKTVANGSLSKQEKETIMSRLNSQLGEVIISIEEVDQIPRGPNGKYQAVISKLNNN